MCAPKGRWESNSGISGKKVSAGLAMPWFACSTLCGSTAGRMGWQQAARRAPVSQADGDKPKHRTCVPGSRGQAQPPHLCPRQPGTSPNTASVTQAAGGKPKHRTCVPGSRGQAQTPRRQAARQSHPRPPPSRHLHDTALFLFMLKCRRGQQVLKRSKLAAAGAWPRPPHQGPPDPAARQLQGVCLSPGGDCSTCCPQRQL